MVCGPTASGKSELADLLADSLTDEYGTPCPALVVDSMQVYREIPAISNQPRRRPAYLRSVASVTEEWNVARHREASDEITGDLDGPFVLDAGTGMYLNAILLDLDLAPKVPAGLRREAVRVSRGAENPRRAARALELELAGVGERSSIWGGELRYATTILYLRPDRSDLDRAISRRSERIALAGQDEAVCLLEMERAGAEINPSVADAIGVRELMAYASGEATPEEARSGIDARTRKLARRQMRWFDKLSRTLAKRATIIHARSVRELLDKHTLHDIIGP